MSSNINHSGFTSTAYGKNKRKYTTRNFSRNYGRKSSPQKEYSGSMLTKMGICALLAGLVLLGEFAQRPDLTMVSSDVNSNSNEQDIGGEYLGKLRFVELPGIIQVFSSDAKLKIDAQYSEYKLDENELILTIAGITSKTFSAPADGIVKTLTNNEDKTKIDLSMDGDIVISFEAEGESAAEEGQPINKGDTLYKAIESIDIAVTKEGRPINPTEYFDVKSTLLS